MKLFVDTDSDTRLARRGKYQVLIVQGIMYYSYCILKYRVTSTSGAGILMQCSLSTWRSLSPHSRNSARR